LAKEKAAADFAATVEKEYSRPRSRWRLRRNGCWMGGYNRV